MDGVAVPQEAPGDILPRRNRSVRSRMRDRGPHGAFASSGYCGRGERANIRTRRARAPGRRTTRIISIGFPLPCGHGAALSGRGAAPARRPRGHGAARPRHGRPAPPPNGRSVPAASRGYARMGGGDTAGCPGRQAWRRRHRGHAFAKFAPGGPARPHGGPPALSARAASRGGTDLKGRSSRLHRPDLGAWATRSLRRVPGAELLPPAQYLPLGHPGPATGEPSLSLRGTASPVRAPGRIRAPRRAARPRRPRGWRARPPRGRICHRRLNRPPAYPLPRR